MVIVTKFITMNSNQCIQHSITMAAAFDDSLIKMYIFVISLIDMFIFVISAGVEPKPASSPAWRLRAGVQLFRPVQQIPGTRRRGRCGRTDDPRHCSPVQL